MPEFLKGERNAKNQGLTGEAGQGYSGLGGGGKKRTREGREKVKFFGAGGIKRPKKGKKWNRKK